MVLDELFDVPRVVDLRADDRHRQRLVLGILGRHGVALQRVDHTGGQGGELLRRRRGPSEQLCHLDEPVGLEAVDHVHLGEGRLGEQRHVAHVLLGRLHEGLVGPAAQDEVPREARQEGEGVRQRGLELLRQGRGIVGDRLPAEQVVLHAACGGPIGRVAHAEQDGRAREGLVQLVEEVEDGEVGHRRESLGHDELLEAREHAGELVGRADVGKVLHAVVGRHLAREGAEAFHRLVVVVEGHVAEPAAAGGGVGRRLLGHAHHMVVPRLEAEGAQRVLHPCGRRGALPRRDHLERVVRGRRHGVPHRLLRRLLLRPVLGRVLELLLRRGDPTHDRAQLLLRRVLHGRCRVLHGPRSRSRALSLLSQLFGHLVGRGVLQVRLRRGLSCRRLRRRLGLVGQQLVLRRLLLGQRGGALVIARRLANRHLELREGPLGRGDLCGRSGLLRRRLRLIKRLRAIPHGVVLGGERLLGHPLRCGHGSLGPLGQSLARSPLRRVQGLASTKLRDKLLLHGGVSAGRSCLVHRCRRLNRGVDRRARRLLLHHLLRHLLPRCEDRVRRRGLPLRRDISLDGCVQGRKPGGVALVGLEGLGGLEGNHGHRGRRVRDQGGDVKRPHIRHSKHCVGELTDVQPARGEGFLDEFLNLGVEDLGDLDERLVLDALIALLRSGVCDIDLDKRRLCGVAGVAHVRVVRIERRNQLRHARRIRLQLGHVHEG
eukprot:scaffold30085_cov63-Phaeocystis_antarctica.AAC.4